MKVVVADIHLIPHRSRLEAGLPDGATILWHAPGDTAVLEDLAEADVFVGSRFTAEMAAAAPRLGKSSGIWGRPQHRRVLSARFCPENQRQYQVA